MLARIRYAGQIDMTTLTSHSATARQAPRFPAFYRVSTREVPADIRIDYWQSHFSASRIDRPRGMAASDFTGDMLSGVLPDGGVFADLRGGPTDCRFGERENGIALLGCIDAGAVEIRHGNNQATTVTPHSRLVLFDCDRPFVTSSRHYAMTYLALPRSLITATLGSDPVPSGKAVRELPSGELATSLGQHLRAIAEHGERLLADEAADTLQTAQALALTTLARMRANRRSLPQGFDDTLLIAARHLLKQHMDDTQSTAERLATALGCSRAHLYRLFARQGQTIAGQLRELRLRQARTLLETQLAQPIGSIAFRCGYTDQSAFGKVFRRRFGLTPGECRERIRSDGTRNG